MRRPGQSQFTGPASPGPNPGLPSGGGATFSQLVTNNTGVSYLNSQDGVFRFDGVSLQKLDLLSSAASQASVLLDNGDLFRVSENFVVTFSNPGGTAVNLKKNWNQSNAATTSIVVADNLVFYGRPGVSSEDQPRQRIEHRLGDLQQLARAGRHRGL